MNDAHTEQAIPQWCPILKVEEALHALKTDVAVIRATVQETRSDVQDVREHQVRQNGAIADIQSDALKAEGGLSMLKWLVTILLGMMGVGVAFAGLILAQGG